MTLEERIKFVDAQIWLNECEILFEKGTDEVMRLNTRNKRLYAIKETLVEDYTTKGGKREIPKTKSWRVRVLNNNDEVNPNLPNNDKKKDGKK